MSTLELSYFIQNNALNALTEDIGSGDLTVQLLPDALAHAQVITRQSGILCGKAWFDSCFLALDPECNITWFAVDGDRIHPGQTLCELSGKAREMLTAERSALNLLQTLSGTATLTRRYVEAVANFKVKIMDTRKTLPGLRHAQKYAVRTGGGHNQRAGLYDGILIKENHIKAAGSIAAVLAKAFKLANEKPVQIEVENIMQLDEALAAGAKLILLDNFDLDALTAAVQRTGGRAELEASGGITLSALPDIAATGVDRISIGALTKNIEALDFSMRIV